MEDNKDNQEFEYYFHLLAKYFLDKHAARERMCLYCFSEYHIINSCGINCWRYLKENGYVSRLIGFNKRSTYRAYYRFTDKFKEDSKNVK